MARIGEIVRQVAFIALLAAFLEMLLPDKKMTRYVRLVLGLFVVVAILTPLAEGLRPGTDTDVTAWDLRLGPVDAVPVQEGREMARVNQEAALEIYRQRLAGQIKALVTLVSGVRTAEVQVSIVSDGELRGAIRRVVVSVIPAEAAPAAGVEVEGEESRTDGQVNPPGVTEQPSPAPEKEKEEQEAGMPAIKPPQGQDMKTPGVGKAVREEAGGQRGEETHPAVTPASARELEERIIAMITHFYSLEPGQVEVLFGR